MKKGGSCAWFHSHVTRFQVNNRIPQRAKSHINLHIYDVIASSLRSWHFRSVLRYERSHIEIQLNAQ